MDRKKRSNKNDQTKIKKIKRKCKVYLKHFSDATTKWMEDYVTPSLRSKPNHFIILVRTSDLMLEKTSKETANQLVILHHY